MKLAWKTPIIAKATAAVVLPFTTVVAAHTAGTNITSTTNPAQSININSSPIVLPTPIAPTSTSIATTQTSNTSTSSLPQAVVNSSTTSELATTSSSPVAPKSSPTTARSNPSFIAGSRTPSASPAPPAPSQTVAPQSPTTSATPATSLPTTTALAPTTTSPAPQIGTIGYSGFAQGAPAAMGQAYGSWIPDFNGYGSIERVNDPVLGDSLNLTPATATSPSATHSALVTTTNNYGDFNATFTYRTVAQLRTGSAPNPWEVGWVLFHYSNNTHFYYFLAKPTGWELGKEDPSYPGNQRFMVTGSTPFPVGNTYKINVVMTGATISVSVNGTPIVTYTDTQSPYTSGSLALYDEDSSVDYAPIVVN